VVHTLFRNIALRQRKLIVFTRDFFVRHSDDDAREARYKHRTWRKSDGGFYVGVDPPKDAKPEGIVRKLSRASKTFADT
jgi:hypothetical protein